MDVSEIVASRNILICAPHFIKPDLSSTERAIETTLLKEHWSLIHTVVNITK